VYFGWEHGLGSDVGNMACHLEGCVLWDKIFCIITTTRCVKRTNFTKRMHEQIKIRKEISINKTVNI
jgi:hypothetical protein